MLGKKRFQRRIGRSGLLESRDQMGMEKDRGKKENLCHFLRREEKIIFVKGNEYKLLFIFEGLARVLL